MNVDDPLINPQTDLIFRCIKGHCWPVRLDMPLELPRDCMQLALVLHEHETCPTCGRRDGTDWVTSYRKQESIAKRLNQRSQA